ncbi:hypothetical protein RND81_11G043700 [Saponaria officinalis]|uniref:Uncharacterized protein n=1 Tax=Saponaria officinalis TaxID=3572 RepID=A0AAW1HHS9_SAPOF
MLIVFTVIVSSIQGVTSQESPRYFSKTCQEKKPYISGSAFETNLNDTLLNDLLSKVSMVKFSNFTKGVGEDQVYALYYCRGDVDAQTCQICVEAATRKITEVCKFCKEGIVWFEECTLRYANRNIFSISEESPYYLYTNSTGIVNDYRLDPYKERFDSTMDDLITQAAYGKRSLKGFASKDVNLSSSSEVILGLAQCCPDIGAWHIAVIVVLSVVVVVALAVIINPRLRRRDLNARVRDRNQHNPPDERVQSPKADNVERKVRGLPKYSFTQVEEMTKGFTKLLGKGGFGDVYYGVLESSREVAVKVLNDNDALEQFTNEIDVFVKISHINLLSLIGYCEDGTKLVLIYEYMDKGDLRVFLSENANSSSWTDRLKIAIDAAEGLLHLHRNCEAHIVHRDVKPANILLNKNLQAKVADFGLAKIFPGKDIAALETRVVSSPGYTDPEYAKTGKLNEKVDVYSFGVVLLELITGREPANLVDWFVELYNEGDIDDIMYSKMKINEDGTPADKKSSVWWAIELARACVEEVSMKRPDMWKVVVKLKECLQMNAANSSSASTSMMSPMISGSITMTPEVR